MISGTVHVTSKDRMAQMIESLKQITSMDVLVGVPSENAGRDDEMNNAQLVFVHTHGARAQSMINEMKGDIASKGYTAAYSMYIASFGSPLWHIPPRPIIEPSIEATDHKDAISDELGQAAKAFMGGKPEEARNHLNRAGQLGENYARDWFDDPRNNWPPLAESTIEAKGSDKPLIDTGEMRKSITHVVRQS